MTPIPTILGLPAIFFTLLGVLTALAAICIVLDRCGQAFIAWRQRRSRRRAPVYVLPRVRVVAVPAAYRKQRKDVWS